MATENERNGKLELSSIAADWDYKASRPTDWPIIPRLLSITFVPGAAADRIVVKEEDDAGPTVFDVTCENTYDQRVKYFHGGRVIPFIDFGDCTFSAGHKVTIQLWREP